MTFELQPTLRGSLLELRPLRTEDWADLFAAASDPRIWEQHPESTRHEEEVFRRFFAGALESGGLVRRLKRTWRASPLVSAVPATSYDGRRMISRSLLLAFSFVAPVAPPRA